MARTIQSPGVEIKEIDQSIRPVVPAGTNILVAGFADKGPTDEIIQVTSRSEFTDIYGEATVPAEFYLSSTTNALLNSPANIFVYRMPYGTGKGIGFGNNYSVLAYPASAMRITKDKATIGIGAGQQNRLDSCKIATQKAKQFQPDKLVNSVAASDAFFPFADGIKTLINAGVKIIVQPGGSIRDKEVIDAANDAKI